MLCCPVGQPSLCLVDVEAHRAHIRNQESNHGAE
jgi:hypothetical protein